MDTDTAVLEVDALVSRVRRHDIEMAVWAETMKSFKMPKSWRPGKVDELKFLMLDQLPQAPQSYLKEHIAVVIAKQYSEDELAQAIKELTEIDAIRQINGWYFTRRNMRR